MTLLDEHKEAMGDGAYLALCDGIRAAREDEEPLYRATYVWLMPYVNGDGDASILSETRTVIVDATSPYAQGEKSAHWLSEGHVHGAWIKEPKPLLLAKDRYGHDVAAIVTSIEPFRKRDKMSPRVSCKSAACPICRRVCVGGSVWTRWRAGQQRDAPHERRRAQRVLRAVRSPVPRPSRDRVEACAPSHEGRARRGRERKTGRWRRADVVRPKRIRSARACV